MDSIPLLLWMKMSIAVALNLWGDIVVSMFFWLFLKNYHCITPKLFILSNLGLAKNVFGVLYLRICLKKCLWANLSKKTKTVNLPLQLMKLILNSTCMPVIPNPLWNLPNLILPISYEYKCKLGLVNKVKFYISYLWKEVPVVMDYMYNPILLW